MTASPARRKSGATRAQVAQQVRGVVEMHGDDWKREPEKLLRAIDRAESSVRSRKKRGRVLGSRTYRGVTKIYVTLPDLARQIGRALTRAFHGSLRFQNWDGEPLLRVIWKSEKDRRHSLRPDKPDSAALSHRWRNRRPR